MFSAKMWYSERGVALVAVIAVMAAVTVIATAALMMSTSGFKFAGRQRSSTQALHVAEAGLSDAFFGIRNGDTSGGTGGITTGEFQTTITKHPSSPSSFNWYIVKSVGHIPTVASANASKRAVEAEVMSLSLYDFLFTDANAGKLVGNATIVGPVYVKDIFYLSGTGASGAKYQVGPLFIKDDPTTGPDKADCGAPGPVDTDCDGDMSIKGSAEVGDSANPVPLFIEGQIIDGELGVSIFADPVSSSVPGITFPVLDLAYLDNTYRSDPAVYIHDDDAVTNLSTDLILGGDKNSENVCLKPGGEPTCRLEWVKDKNQVATLAIDGTIFVDGKVKIGAKARGTDVTYSGVGTIVATGEIAIEGGLHTADHPDGDFLTNDVLGFVSPSTFNVVAKDGAIIETIVYAKEHVEIRKKIYFYGSLASTDAVLDENPTVYILSASGFLPPGMPDIGDSVVSMTSWKEVSPD